MLSNNDSKQDLSAPSSHWKVIASACNATHKQLHRPKFLHYPCTKVNLQLLHQNVMSLWTLRNGRPIILDVQVIMAPTFRFDMYAWSGFIIANRRISPEYMMNVEQQENKNYCQQKFQSSDAWLTGMRDQPFIHSLLMYRTYLAVTFYLVNIQINGPMKTSRKSQFPDKE